ncbi:AAA family ATPase [Mesorhizobium opportunistum]|uniref:AAA family ATPase n=1 Tax=Mesorhizobium opportunistum TaxID=593909 RepID=UPI00333DE3DE
MFETETEDKDPIPIRKLSSGEKQLLIFLSETLLQEQAPFIFLADEPELSLHVEWQEELVPNLLRINPNAQVLFATHSPDIVNKYQANIVEMEKMID